MLIACTGSFCPSPPCREFDVRSLQHASTALTMQRHYTTRKPKVNAHLEVCLRLPLTEAELPSQAFQSPILRRRRPLWPHTRSGGAASCPARSVLHIALEIHDTPPTARVAAAVLVLHQGLRLRVAPCVDGTDRETDHYVGLAVILQDCCNPVAWTP